MIVDDESLAREELQRLIAEDQEFQIVATAATGKEALRKIEQSPVDVVFLDIEMPGMNGLEVASSLARAEAPPRIVFATAYNQYAIDAFTMNAIDYLLKPYQPDRLRATLERIKKVLKTKEIFREKLIALEDTLIQKGVLKKIVGRRANSKDRVLIDPEEVFYFYAHLAQVTAHLADKDWTVNMTLEEIEAILDPLRFARSHRAYIVNLSKVEKVVPMFNENYELILKDSIHTHVPLARRNAKEFKQKLSNW